MIETQMFDNRQSRGEIYPLLPTGTGKLLELFAGSRSVGSEAEAMGMEVFSVDWQKFDKINLAISF